MKKNAIKIRILIPLTVAMTILIAGFIIDINHSKQSAITSELKNKIETVPNIIKAKVEEDANMIMAMIDILTSNTDIKRAFRAGDRAKLLTLTEDIFDELLSHKRITHLYFIDAKRINLLRVHKPDKYGDIINRHTLLRAESTGNTYYGLELGSLGTFTLRVVQPLHDEKGLIGYLELGEEIDHLISETSRITGTDLIFLIYKKYLDRERWEAGMKIIGRDHNWDLSPSSIIVSQTIDMIPENLKNLIEKHDHDYDQNFSLEETTTDNKKYRWGFHPFYDVSGTEVGDLAILLDVTKTIDTAQRSIFRKSIFILLIGMIVFIILYIFVNRVEKYIFGINEEIEGWNRELEKRVKEQTDELVESQAQLVHADKLASLGQLAAGLAHELSTPLTGLISMIRHYRKNAEKDSEKSEELSLMLRSCNYMAKIVKDFTIFSGKSKGDVKELQLSAVLASSLSLIANRLRSKNIQLIKDYSYELPMIKGNMTELQQVALNIINNAVDAMDQGGDLVIQTGLSEDKNYVILMVKDNGCGMDSEKTERIFEPFFTTKPQGKGTGLGLSVSYTIVKNHGGDIKVESEIGKGTEFKVLLPAIT